jgi:hypothetical protein
VNYSGRVKFSYVIHLRHSWSISYDSAYFNDTANYKDKNVALEKIFGPKREEVTED